MVILKVRLKKQNGTPPVSKEEKEEQPTRTVPILGIDEG